MSEIREPIAELGRAVVEGGAETLFACMQCGLCTASCPWRLVQGEISEQFNIRRVEHMAQFGIEGYETENVLFGCTTCGQCAVRCPREVDPVTNVRVLRAMIAESGSLPAGLRAVVGSLKGEGNPWQGERKARTAWADGLDVPKFSSGTEYLLFVCCTSCYDARSKKIARALTSLLKKAGVSFGIIGEEESCCGESARKVGAEDVFQKLAASNMKLFAGQGVKKIIVTSPHCLFTFKKEYPELGGSFEVVHHTELLAGLLKSGKLQVKNRLAEKTALHDPCYLGRHNEIFEPPRSVLQAACENSVELSRHGPQSVCCGGGGGRLWLETPPGARFGDLRVADALASGAKVIATACPYCTIMLDASNPTEQPLEIKDLAELLDQAT